jgi:hypothetical protein
MEPKFLVTKYDDECWLQNFKMWKQTHIVNQLKPLIHKKDTKYKLFILVEVQVVSALYKLVQGCNLLICNELFVVGLINNLSCC